MFVSYLVPLVKLILTLVVHCLIASWEVTSYHFRDFLADIYSITVFSQGERDLQVSKDVRPSPSLPHSHK